MDIRELTLILFFAAAGVLFVFLETGRDRDLLSVAALMLAIVALAGAVMVIVV